MQAIRLKSRSALYWSSLAQCFYIQARYRSDDQRLLELAVEYMKVAVSLKPNDYLLWNALGVIVAHPGRVSVTISSATVSCHSRQRAWICAALFLQIASAATVSNRVHEPRSSLLPT